MVRLSVLKSLDLKPSDLTRVLGISSGHASDINGGRRKLTLEHALKLERELGRQDIVNAVVAERASGV